MSACYWLLCSSIALVWLKKPSGGVTAWLWAIALGASICAALAEHVVSSSGALGLALLFAMCLAAARSPEGSRRHAITLAALILAFAFALHLIPGFHNEQYLVQLSSSEQPAPKYINFDKGAAGLLLLAFFCPRVSNAQEAARAVRALITIGLPTVALTVLFAVVTGLGHVHPRLPGNALIFVITNVFFTCVAEEAAFRGVIQGQLSRRFGFGPDSIRAWLPILVSTVLFVGAHAGPRPAYLVGVAIAGLGYSMAFARARTVEAPIVIHAVLNGVVFFVLSVNY